MSNTHQNCAISAVPSPMKIARSARAPKMPQNSTRCWYFSGIPRLAKSIAQTNTLSTLSDFSMTYPERYSPNAAEPKAANTTTEKARPKPTHTIDSVSASRRVGSWSSRCRYRSTASITAMMPRSAPHPQSGTSMSTNWLRTCVEASTAAFLPAA